MTRLVLPIEWRREANGWWRGKCPGEGCGRRLAKAQRLAEWEITAERGYLEGLKEPGVYDKSHRFKDHYPARSRSWRKLREAGAPAPPAGQHPRNLAEAMGARGPRLKAGDLLRCDECKGLAGITIPEVLPRP